MGKLNIKEIKKKAIVISEPDFSYIDGAYLRRFRMELKMSQSLLASYLGVSKKAIEKWEQGKNKLNPVVVRMIYLLEKEPKIFSLMKEIKISEKVIDFKPVELFNPGIITNNENIKNNAVSCEETVSFNYQWDCKNEKSLGGKNYASASV